MVPAIGFVLFFRQRAGRAYTANRYRAAHDLYSEAICVDLEDYYTNALLYANRAAALMNLARNKDALRDCEAVSGRGGCLGGAVAAVAAFRRHEQ